jgi:hypothetical protein
MIKADTFHTCAGLLRRAGASKAPKARRLRIRALEVLKEDLSENPRVEPYLEYVSYDPSQFTGHRKEWAAFTQGWSDANTAAGQPRAYLNQDAFESVMFLTTVVHHEGPGHVRQRFNPGLYRSATSEIQSQRNYWNFREFEAHFNDLQHRKALGMTPLTKSYGLERAEECWWALSDRHRSSLRNHYTGTRQFVLQELHDTPFRNPPSYSHFSTSHSFQLRNYARGLDVSPTTFPSALRQMGRGLYR